MPDSNLPGTLPAGKGGLSLAERAAAGLSWRGCERRTQQPSVCSGTEKIQRQGGRVSPRRAPSSGGPVPRHVGSELLTPSLARLSPPVPIAASQTPNPGSPIVSCQWQARSWGPLDSPLGVPQSEEESHHAGLPGTTAPPGNRWDMETPPGRPPGPSWASSCGGGDPPPGPWQLISPVSCTLEREVHILVKKFFF